jgi:hypothetical protein
MQMQTLLVQSKSKKDMKMFADLAKKVGLSTHFLDKDEMEDMALAMAMKKGRTGEYTDSSAYLKKLKSK